MAEERDARGFTRRTGRFAVAAAALATLSGVVVSHLGSFGVAHQLAHLGHALLALAFVAVLLFYIGRHAREAAGLRGMGAWTAGLLVYAILREIVLRAMLRSLVVLLYLGLVALVWRFVDRRLRKPIVIGCLVTPIGAGLLVQALGGEEWMVVFPLFYYAELLCLVALILARPGRLGSLESYTGGARHLGALVLFGAIASTISGLMLGLGAGQMQTGTSFIVSHRVASLGLAVVLVAHLGMVARSRWPSWRAALASADVRRWFAGVAVAGVLAGAALFVAVQVVERIDRRPELAAFVPVDMARPARLETSSGRVLGAVDVGDSTRCLGCHPTQFAHWQSSAHRHSTGPLFRALVETARAEKGPAAERYCLGCHAPTAILTGELAGGARASETSLDAGVSCASCHVLEAASGALGNASHVVADDRRLIFEQAGSYQHALTGILFRLAGEQHRMRYAKEYLSAPEMCAGCHVQELDPALGPHAGILQDTHSSWSESRFAERARRDEPAAGCADCHMPLTYLSENEEPIHDHRVFGGSPAAARARGDVPTAELTEAWLAGDREALLEDSRRWFREYWRSRENPFQLGALSGEAFEATMRDLYEEKFLGRQFPPEQLWPTGPLLGLVLYLEANEGDGAPRLVARLTNRAIGHRFPAAPGDLADAWIVLWAEDAAGERRALVGGEGLDGAPAAGTRLGELPVDADGRPVDRHRVWRIADHADGPVVDPGDSVVVDLGAPAALPAGTRRLTAELRYRFPGARIVREVLGADAELAEAVVLASGTLAVEPVAASSSLPR